MAGSQTPGDLPAGRSGGKILKDKRIAARTTPYDRPIPHHPLPEPESPNWLTGLVSPAKFVAGGASKILSSIWNPKSWSAHSSTASDSEAESEDDSGDDGNSSDGADELTQKSSQKSETLNLIEQLLLLEQFSREECDRLIEIINSRVVTEGVDAGPSMIHSSTYNENPDIRSQAIMEAKKWVEQNKVKSGLRSDLDNGTFVLKPVVAPLATEGEAGSPVNVAKSYMKARPPWASPINYDNSLTTSSPLAADLLKERTPFSSGGGLSFSSAKRDTLSAGTWNIQDEIRRVRSKATEDMLNSHRSARLALSTIEHDTPKRSLAKDTSIDVGRNGPVNLETPKSVDESVNVAAAGDMRTAQIDLTTEDLPSHPVMPDLEQYQGIHSDKKQNGAEKDEDNEKDNEVDKNCFFMTESPDIPQINNSQDSIEESLIAKKKDGIPESPMATRASTRSTRRGKGKRPITAQDTT